MLECAFVKNSSQKVSLIPVPKFEQKLLPIKIPFHELFHAFLSQMLTRLQIKKLQETSYTDMIGCCVFVV